WTPDRDLALVTAGHMRTNHDRPRALPAHWATATQDVGRRPRRSRSAGGLCSPTALAAGGRRSARGRREGWRGGGASPAGRRAGTSWRLLGRAMTMWEAGSAGDG